MLDLAGGSQSSITDKATGQAIFAEASERRMRQAKRKYIEWYEQVVIMLLKLAQENWSEEKIVNITDEEGKDEAVAVSSADLKDIDFDTDIHIDGESATYNRDVLRQQAIELYNITKDDPIVNRKAIFSDVVQDGFSKSNPERYIQEAPVAPGTALVDPNTGEQYIVDETGELVSQQMQQGMAEPTGGVGEIPQTQMGSVNIIQ